MTQAVDRWREVAEQLADLARKTVRPYFRSGLSVEAKGTAGFDPVTEADRQAETVMRERLEVVFPEHGIIGEEHGKLRPESRWQWVLDPIDGTRAFIMGSPLFGTLIALLEDGEPLVGVIDASVQGERWIGVRGQGASYVREYPEPLNLQLQTSQTTELGQALIGSTDPSMFSGAQWERVQRLYEKTRMRRYGGDCYLYGMLALGCVDVVVEANLASYDVMALIPVVQEAGGVVTDWSGNTVTLAWDGTLLASANPALHEQALAALKGASHLG
jgi:histidinol phosphatase-like enzyme (inositol monophosphatase family)